MSYCKCTHQLRNHDWNLVDDGPQPCTLCDCEDFVEDKDYNPFVDYDIAEGKGD